MAKVTKQQKLLLVGVDEAGRGALAGPVIACAVLLLKKENIMNIDIDDSKKLSPQKRENSHKILIEHPDVKWGIGLVSEKIIDKINIREATRMAMKIAVSRLNYKRIHLIIDGDFTIDSNQKQEAVRGADKVVLECMIASIIAKVERDKIMKKYDNQYPEYGFKNHKGYGTKFHYEALLKNGPCLIHRRSYRLS